jgi:hypothetical protein
MITINRDKAIELLTDVVAQRGDNYVYPVDNSTPNLNCFYTRDGVPSCGIGLALFNAGVDIDTLERMDDNEQDDGTGTGIGESEILSVLKNEGFDITQDAVQVFTQFQTDQDAQAPYSEALTNAKEES